MTELTRHLTISNQVAEVIAPNLSNHRQHLRRHLGIVCVHTDTRRAGCSNNGYADAQMNRHVHAQLC